MPIEAKKKPQKTPKPNSDKVICENRQQKLRMVNEVFMAEVKNDNGPSKELE